MSFARVLGAAARRHAVAVIAAAGILVHSAGAGMAQGTPPSFADLAESLVDTVVNISTSQTVAGDRGIPLPDLPEGSPFEDFFKEFFERNQQTPRSRRVSSLGSGFVVDASGIIVTNSHVIEDADEIEVNFSDGTTLSATVRGRDPKTDLAILEVEPPEGYELRAAEFGRSEDMRVGDWVMAIGNPFGLGGTVTVGIVSARNRDINSGPYDDYIQTDASINRGNSGGPLFDVNGTVVGINTAIISPTGGSIGIGFAIPVETAMPVIAQLREYGETRRGWLGVRIQNVTDEIAESLEMDRAMGALVAGVSPDSPAADVGIETGDVVIEFDSRPIEEMRELPRFVAETAIGKQVVIKVLRKGRTISYLVTIARLAEDEAAEAESEEEEETEEPVSSSVLGLTLAEVNEELREKYELGDETEGLVILEVDETSAAYEKGLREGDVIVQAAHDQVTSLQQFVAQIDEMQSESRALVLLLVRRANGDMSYVAVRLSAS